jgi:hypothetical protein
MIPSISDYVAQLNIGEPNIYLVRQLFDATYSSSDLLAEPELPEIDVLICCTEKDLRSLPEVVDSIFQHSLNPVREITIISPKKLDLSNLNLKYSTRINNVLDEIIIDKLEMNLIEGVSPQGRTGWVTQQVLKIKYAIDSTSKYLLVIDSDTILLQPHAFVNKSGTQTLSISYEKHMPYLEHSSRYFNSQKSKKSYVTHYQLWQTAFIKEMFPQSFDSICEWLRLGQTNEASGFSEFHCYGMWLEMRHPNNRIIISWRNLNISHEKWNRNTLNEVSVGATYGPLNSVSVHSYLG